MMNQSPQLRLGKLYPSALYQSPLYQAVLACSTNLPHTRLDKFTKLIVSWPIVTISTHIFGMALSLTSCTSIPSVVTKGGVVQKIPSEQTASDRDHTTDTLLTFVSSKYRTCSSFKSVQRKQRTVQIKYRMVQKRIIKK